MQIFLPSTSEINSDIYSLNKLILLILFNYGVFLNFIFYCQLKRSSEWCRDLEEEMPAEFKVVALVSC